ncbi:MAG: hypothetical protein PHR28_02275 [candidate division Zixibacteria bacterium]|nr:hypothetical protein [candidate division Zixibacteria bacterium]
MLWFIGIVLALITTWYSIDIFRNRHPLNPEEIMHLAEKRRRIKALSQFAYRVSETPADPEEKKAMIASGEFKTCDMDYFTTPSRLAGLLKYKKHEWIVVAFVTGQTVHAHWWNKGRDGKSVSLRMLADTYETVFKSYATDTVLILHNHPNSDPSRFRTDLPSETDLQTANCRHQDLIPRGKSLLEFVCERGIPHLYYAAFHADVLPIRPMISEIEGVNGLGVFGNYKLRREMRKKTQGDIIPGGTLVLEDQL